MMNDEKRGIRDRESGIREKGRAEERIKQKRRGGEEKKRRKNLL
ncbi:MAG: hypothetical protein NT166_04520 [Candidatus Aminicenantes bacterium]|nr:hypothetical protein [Candidatus Aminicenantes bacterium]